MNRLLVLIPKLKEGIPDLTYENVGPGTISETMLLTCAGVFFGGEHGLE